MLTGHLPATAQMRARTLLAAVLLVLPASVSAQVVEYYHLDALGNVRAVTNQGPPTVVVERHDYLPFGEEWNPQPGTQPKRFTGKERDAETGLDYFGARYYGSRIGRFTIIDPVLDTRGALFNAQKWNRYAYVSNNPLRYVDPDGREQITVTVNSFIPSRFITTPYPMKGDGRDLYEAGTSRTSQTVVVETDAAKSETGLVSAPPGQTGPSLGFGRDGILTSGKASAEGLKVTVNRNEFGDVQINATGSATYPNFFVAAPIRYNLAISVSDRQGQIGVGVTGTHTRFPGFEVLAQREGSNVRQPVYGRAPGQSGVAPLGIFGSVTASGRRTLEDK